MNKAFIIILVLLIVGFGAFFLYRTPTEEIAPTVTNSLIVGENAIYVSDQKPAAAVNIGFAILAEDGFVVVHEDNGGKPGAIIGNSVFLLVGDTRNFSVNLSRVAVDNEYLFAMFHKDSGDGVFNPVEDVPVRDDQGNVVLMRFLISNIAEEPGVINL